MSKEINDKTLKLYQESYEANSDKGTIFFTFINLVLNTYKDIDVIKFGTNIVNIDKSMMTKSSTIQKFIITRYIISTLLELKAAQPDIKIVNAISLCNSMIKDDVWLDIMIGSIIPFLKEHNSI